jgi:hypothetical protein
MSERWKYQFKVGLIWGFLMAVFNLLFELQEKPISVQLSSPAFYLKVLIYTLTGIFLLGYINWRQKVKQQKNQ